MSLFGGRSGLITAQADVDPLNQAMTPGIMTAGAATTLPTRRDSGNEGHAQPDSDCPNPDDQHRPARSCIMHLKPGTMRLGAVESVHLSLGILRRILMKLVSRISRSFTHIIPFFALLTLLFPLQTVAAAPFLTHDAGVIRLAHRVHVSHTIVVRHGHGPRGLFGPSFIHTLRSSALREQTPGHAASERRAAAEFGTVLTVHRHTILVRWTPWRTRVVHGKKLYLMTRGSSGHPVLEGLVMVSPRTWLAVPAADGHVTLRHAKSLAGLHPGMPLFLGGVLTHGGMRAGIVADLAAGRNIPLTKAEVSHARRVDYRPLGGARPESTQTGNFQGGLIGAGQLSYSYSDDFTNGGANSGVEIFEIPYVGVNIYVKRFDFIFDPTGSTNYNWPFQFSATNPGLYRTEQGSIPVQVTPQQLPNQASTYFVGLGFDVGLAFHVHTPVGCGTLDLQSCELDPSELHLGMGAINSTSGAAPMQGQDLSVPHQDCPGVGFSIPDTPFDIATLNLCFDETLHGSNFQADVSATGASAGPTTMYFDGSTPQTYSLLPTSNAVGLTFDNFQWDPSLEFGFNLQVNVAKVFTYNFPTVDFQSNGGFPMIGDSSLLSPVNLQLTSAPSEEDFTIPVSKEPTQLQYNTASLNCCFGLFNALTADYHDAVTVYGTLSNRAGYAVNGKMLNFELNNNPDETCSGATGYGGVASCQITVTDPPSSTPESVAISFAGDDTYAASSVTGGMLIVPEESGITYTGASQQDYHDTVTLSASLNEDTSGPAITNQPLTFALGSQSCTGMTGTDGSASCTININQEPGNTSVSVSFGGSSLYQSSSLTSLPFTIGREETSLTYNGAQLIANHRPATLGAMLQEDGTTAPAPAGQSVVLTLGSGAGAQSCTGTTDSSGTAACQIASVDQPDGNAAVSAAFTGDSYYRPSSDSSQQRLVFDYLPGGGSFALGNLTATSTDTVTWWGAQWAMLNSLSGGAAPDAFKGFVQQNTPAGDPTCGGSWSSKPGNSPSPPATVPDYMAVVVPSAVAKSGSTIEGDISKIVIVRTVPGYGPDPSQAGTGTVVATLCHS